MISNKSCPTWHGHQVMFFLCSERNCVGLSDKRDCRGQMSVNECFKSIIQNTHQWTDYAEMHHDQYLRVASLCIAQQWNAQLTFGNKNIRILFIRAQTVSCNIKNVSGWKKNTQNTHIQFHLKHSKSVLIGERASRRQLWNEIKWSIATLDTLTVLLSQYN
jgi:hypothetical protein